MLLLLIVVFLGGSKIAKEKFNLEKIYLGEFIQPSIRYSKLVINEVFYTLFKAFDKNNTFPNKERVQPLLILLPVKSKDKIVSAMLSRIYNMQNI